MRIRMIGIALCFSLLTGVAQAVTFSGYLDDAGNTALVGSGVAPSAPDFTDDWAIANNVALYGFTASSAGTFNFKSFGFAAGGIDPYFTLFSGAGAFLGSNNTQAFSTGGDFDLNFALSAGSYTIAMGAFANMSFAENFGSGTLADGFIGLGGPSFLGFENPYYYELEVTARDTPPPTPEPVTFVLLATGLIGLAAAKRRIHQ